MAHDGATVQVPAEQLHDAEISLLRDLYRCAHDQSGRPMRHHGLVSRWLDRRSPWQFALLWWAAAMACCVLGVVSADAWRGGHVSGGPLVGAFFISVLAAASAVWSRRRHRLRAQQRA